MILNRELLNDAIGKKRPIRKLFKTDTGNLLDDYVVGDYVTTDKIPALERDGNGAKVSASSFFEEHQHLMRFEVDDILKTFDAGFVKDYHKQKRFPFEYTINFFDTFIVAEIMPSSLTTEFVVISPLNGGQTELMNDVTAFTVVTTLCTATSREHGLQLALYINVDQLLEYFRTGLGKKKLFGIF